MAAQDQQASRLQSSEQNAHLDSFWVLRDSEVYYQSPRRGTLSPDTAMRFYSSADADVFADDRHESWETVEVLYAPVTQVRDALDHYGM